MFDVVYGGDRVEILGVSGRKTLAKTAVQLETLFLAAVIDQRVAEIVLPGADRLGDAFFQGTDGDSRRAARFKPHDDMDPREVRVRELHCVLGLAAVAGVQQDPLDPFAHLGAVFVPRYENQAGNKPAELVAAHEQFYPLAFLQVEDAPGNSRQVLDRDLKQFVARVIVEYVHQRFAAVARAPEAGQFEYLRGLVAKQRDLARIAAVRGRCVETEKTLLANDFSVFVESLYADVVEIGRAMHGRVGTGFGYYQ